MATATESKTAEKRRKIEKKRKQPVSQNPNHHGLCQICRTHEPQSCFKSKLNRKKNKKGNQPKPPPATVLDPHAVDAVRHCPVDAAKPSHGLCSKPKPRRRLNHVAAPPLTSPLPRRCRLHLLCRRRSSLLKPPSPRAAPPSFATDCWKKVAGSRRIKEER